MSEGERVVHHKGPGIERKDEDRTQEDPGVRVDPVVDEEEHKRGDAPQDNRGHRGPAE